MKTIRPTLLCLLIVAPLYLFAETIPANYYDDIDGKSDSILKSTLSQICRGGVRYEYGTTQYHSTNDPNGQWQKGDLKAYGTWQAFPLTDIREDGTIWDMYSNSQRYFPAKQGESGCSLQIEHCLPKSWWGWSNTDTRDVSLMAYKDLWNLNPSDAQANGQKSNYPPGHVKKADKFTNGSFKMDKANSSGYGYICFEPAPEYRGDFARAYFYIATAYENIQWSSSYTQYVDQSSYLMFADSIRQVLLDWHRSDPVSDKEICRADRISSIQHNRNPYIDYPDLVEFIWGDRKGEAVSLASLTCTENTADCDSYLPGDQPGTDIAYDTLLSFPALTKAIVNAVQNCFASDKIQAAGSASITMGASTTDGWLEFSNLNIQDSAVLTFRASIYNTANSMQLDIYAGETLVKTITETAVQNTRNETRYRVNIPASTSNIKIMSVGGGTTKRACMQELYLLKPKANTTPTSLPENTMQTDGSDMPQKVLRDGQMFIIVNNRTFNMLGL